MTGQYKTPGTAAKAASRLEGGLNVWTVAVRTNRTTGEDVYVVVRRPHKLS